MGWTRVAQTWMPAVAVTALLMVITLPMVVEHGAPSIVAASVLCIAGGLCLMDPRHAGIVAGAAITVPLLLGLVGQNLPVTGVALFVSPATVSLCAMRGWWRAALLLGAWHTAALALAGLITDDTLGEALGNIVVWAVLMSLALAVGTRIHRLIESVAQERAQRVADLAEQRRLLARELHDTAVRATTEVVLHAERAARTPGVDPGSVEEFSRISRTARLATDDLRSLMETLRDAEDLGTSLDEVALRAATWQDVLSSTRDRLTSEGFTVRVNHDGDAPLPPRLLGVLERCLQEIRSNVTRHGDRAVPVAIMSEIVRRPEPSAPTARASDAERGSSSASGLPGVDLVVLNGIAPQEHDLHGGAGLDGVRERLATVGGALEAHADGDRFLTRISIPA